MADLGIRFKVDVILQPNTERPYIEDAYGRRIYFRRAEKAAATAPGPITAPSPPPPPSRSRELVAEAWVVGGGWDSRCCPRCVSYRGQVYKKRIVSFPLHPNCHHFWVPIYKGITDAEQIHGEPVVASIDQLKLDPKTLVAVYGKARVRLMKEDGLTLSDLYHKGTDRLKTLAELGVERSFARTGKRILTQKTVAKLSKKALVEQIRIRDADFKIGKRSVESLRRIALSLTEKAA